MRLPLAEQDAAARVVRQLVTPSGRKVSHEPSDLAEYAHVDDAELRRLLERLGRRADRARRQRDAGRADALRDLPRRPRAADPGVAGRASAAARADPGPASAAPPARGHRCEPRRAAIVAAIAAYALVQRSDARTQARHARGGELAGRALADIPTNPQVSVNLALQAARARPGPPDRRRPPLEPRRDA